MENGLSFIQPKQERAYQVWLFKATDELLFLGKTKEAIKSYETAAQWAQMANTEEGLKFSKIYKGTAEYLKRNPDSRRVRASSWMMILGNARDNQTRDFALQNLRDLGANIAIEEGGALSITIPDDIK